LHLGRAEVETEGPEVEVVVVRVEVVVLTVAVDRARAGLDFLIEARACSRGAMPACSKRSATSGRVMGSPRSNSATSSRE
jgi:hypothetical protein